MYKSSSNLESATTIGITGKEGLSSSCHGVRPVLTLKDTVKATAWNLSM